MNFEIVFKLKKKRKIDVANIFVILKNSFIFVFDFFSRVLISLIKRSKFKFLLKIKMILIKRSKMKRKVDIENDLSLYVDNTYFFLKMHKEL